jgi:hypothetical protein
MPISSTAGTGSLPAVSGEVEGAVAVTKGF